MTATPTAANPDLRTVFAWTLDKGPVNPVDVSDAMQAMGRDCNSRYARELIGLLAHHGLGQFTSDGSYESDYWETPAIALSAFVGRFPTERKPAAREENPANLPQCACGCGNPVRNRRMHFRQGHDAKFVSLQVATTIDRGAREDIQQRIGWTTSAIANNHSDALATKYRDAALNRWAKLVAAAERKPAAAAPTIIPGEPVKIGRWTYPTRTVDGVAQRNCKRDGSGEWVARSRHSAK